MRPTRATVRLDAIANNLKVAHGFAPQSKIMAVIKANAYGHGAIAVARVLQANVPAFAVAFIDEAVQLRDAGISRPILILQGTTTASDVAEAAARDFWLMAHSRQQVERILNTSTAKPVQVWIKVDTGMNRLGLAVDELDGCIEALLASENTCDEMVLCSHLACADELGHPMTMKQIEMSRGLTNRHKLPLSLANSAGILCWPQSHAEWNRPGYMLYGNSPFLSLSAAESGLQPAMSMQSEIISIRELSAGEGTGYGQSWVAEKASTIGVIPIGYADGYPRHAANGTPVLVNGKRVPLVGRVSMGMITVDLSGIEPVKSGDSVELWGENLSVNEVAQSAGTIGYEILAGLTGRVPISYIP